MGKDSREGSAQCSVRGQEQGRLRGRHPRGEGGGRGLDGHVAGPFSAALLHYEAPKGYRPCLSCSDGKPRAVSAPLKILGKY